MDAAAAGLEALGSRIEGLQAYFQSGATREFAFRRDALRALKSALKDNEEALLAALHADMRKPRFEAYMGELAQVHAEIDHALENLSAWMEPEHVAAPLALWPHSSSIRVRPLGVVLIIAPWNYPVLLALEPMADALAAGNAVCLKPSELSPNTSKLLAELVPQYLDSEAVRVVDVDRMP